MLPVLTVNRSFIHEFMDAETPCGALGLVEENGRQSGPLQFCALPVIHGRMPRNVNDEDRLCQRIRKWNSL